jgi:hypothetical protein
MTRAAHLISFCILIAACGGRDTAIVGDGPACDDSACAAFGGACTTDEVCVRACPGGDCGNLIRCPAGLRCEVECIDPGSCSGGIDCGDAYSCAVRCLGTDSCANEVTCGDGPCIVECSGSGSCDNGATCRDACACDVLCTGAGSCSDPAVCPTASCNDGPGCAAGLDGCNVCD